MTCRSIYCELEHHLLSLDQNLYVQMKLSLEFSLLTKSFYRVKIAKVAKKTGGDREVRLAEALGDSATPEEVRPPSFLLSSLLFL